MIPMLVMEVTIMDVVQVTIMFNRGMTAIGPMDMRMNGVGQMGWLG
ncbi:MAG: hypothetical protein RL119_794 [Actinomycetota bacterium]|jgi:hypothetical protein